MGVSLLYVIGSRSGAVNRMGSENEVEQSLVRPRTVTDGAELARIFHRAMAWDLRLSDNVS